MVAWTRSVLVAGHQKGTHIEHQTMVFSECSIDSWTDRLMDGPTCDDHLHPYLYMRYNYSSMAYLQHCFNTLRPRPNCRHFTDDIFKCIFLNENVLISLKISLKIVPKLPINNILALVHIMAWRRHGNKPLSEPMLVSLLTHICVTRPQWVNWSVVEDRHGWGNMQHCLTWV